MLANDLLLPLLSLPSVPRDKDTEGKRRHGVREAAGIKGEAGGR